MAVQMRFATVIVVLLASHTQLTSAARRSVVYTSTGQRATKRANLEEDLLLAEDEALSAAESNMTIDSAYQTLKQSGDVPADLFAFLDEQLPVAHPSMRRHSMGLVQKNKPSKALLRARDMINSMIDVNNFKLDKLKTECSNFFRKQCTLLETCRQEIATANSQAADSRSTVLSSQGGINQCEDRIPRVKKDLRINVGQCTDRLRGLKKDLKIVLEDIEVILMILKMTECGKAAMIQTEEAALHIVKCKHPCTNQSYLTFHHAGLNEKLAQLKSPALLQRVQQGLGELDAETNATNGSVIVNKTMFKNPPLPQLPVPKDPCKGIKYSARAGKKSGCTLRSRPQCFNLQNKFLLIQGEAVDRRDELLVEIKHVEGSCKKTQDAFKEQIGFFEAKQDKENAVLAQATGAENDAAQEAREKGEEFKELEKAMFQSRKECSEKMRVFKSELCALKKIRGELFKMKGHKHPLFQDCAVSKWAPEDCSRSCAGGVQTLRRSIVAPQGKGGASCPPLVMKRACNQHPCPIDCRTSTWSGFSACSADCGGGVRERTRKIRVHGRYDGTPCGTLAQTEPCNVQACDQNCKLGHWSKFSTCSKACGGGTKTARRTIKVAAVGQGTCPSPKSRRRLLIKKCGMRSCPASKKVWKCKGKIDLVLLLDASASMKKSGWDKTKAFASKLVSAFKGQDTFVSVVAFGGPQNWGDYLKCNGPKASKLNQEKVCGVKLVQHFSNDTAKTVKNIAKQAWLKGSTFTAKAFELASAEIPLGRKDAMRVVLTMTDGLPVSLRSTGIAADKLRKRARIMVGAVRLTRKGLGKVSAWSSSPKRANVMRISSFMEMMKTSTVNRFLRDMCTAVTA